MRKANRLEVFTTGSGHGSQSLPETGDEVTDTECQSSCFASPRRPARLMSESHFANSWPTPKSIPPNSMVCGEDILIGGTTSHSGGTSATPTAANVSALNAIMAEWKRTDLAYAARGGHLQAASGGLNGSTLLNNYDRLQ